MLFHVPIPGSCLPTSILISYILTNNPLTIKADFHRRGRCPNTLANCLPNWLFFEEEYALTLDKPLQE